MRTSFLALSLAFLVLLLASVVQAETVTISKETPFAEGSGASDKVKQECDIQGRLPKYLKSYAKSHTDVEFTTEPLDKVEGKVLYLKFEHVFAPGGGGYSGTKSVSVVGELKENGEVIGSLTIDRTALFGMSPGTCSMLKRVAKKIGKEVAEWLAAPTMDAMLGDAAN